MSNVHYQLYVKSVLRLVKTLVVKYDLVGQIINDGLVETKQFSTEPELRETWKYYLNMSGQYHVTDTPMTIRSLEHGVVLDIDFTRENLLARPTTAREYFYGSSFYQQLVSRYPGQEELILGILSPIVENADASIGIAASIQKAVNGKDGDILYFDSKLIEENEVDLIPRLEKWIKGYIKRWIVPQYAITDDLYIQTALFYMYAALPQVIMNIRLSNCHTPRAHSFHIREFLESNGKLGSYMDSLTKAQALALYKNIRYINRHPGSQQTFKWLVQNVLTVRDLPLSYYALRHNYDDLPTLLDAKVEMARFPINYSTRQTGSNVVDPEYILNKETIFERDGKLDVNKEAAYIREKMSSSPDGSIITKVLESAVLDNTDSVTYPLEDVLFNNWVWRAAKGQYNAPIFFTYPATGERMMLSALEAFILYLYVFNLAENTNADGGPVKLPTIPTFSTFDIYRETPPSLAQLQNCVDVGLVGLDQLQLILDNPIEVPLDFTNTDEFYTSMVEVQERMMRNGWLYSSQTHFMVHGYMRWAVSMLYLSEEVELADPDTSYEDWLNDKGFELDTLSKVELRALYADLYRAATGIGDNASRSLRTTHAQLISLMARLSSYNVQYIRDINNGSLIIEDAADIRLGDIDVDAAGSANVELPVLGILSQSTSVVDSSTENMLTEVQILSSRSGGSGTFDIGWEFQWDVTSDSFQAIQYVELPAVELEIVEPNVVDIENIISGLMEGYDVLPLGSS